MGDFQVLSLSANGISSRYAFGGEDMFAQLTGLLFDVLFDPLKDQEGLFPEEGFRQEQRQLLEMPGFRVQRQDGLRPPALRGAAVPGAERRPGPVRLPGGCGSPGAPRRHRGVGGAFAERQNRDFRPGRLRPGRGGVPRPVSPAWARHSPPACWPIRPLARPAASPRSSPCPQSKLSMAYLADYTPEERPLFRLMAAALGGVPSSKLFQNVREKMSLCYYCSTGMGAGNRAMFIESGVETANLERARGGHLPAAGGLAAGGNSPRRSCSPPSWRWSTPSAR